MWKWVDGRQGTGYKKMLLATNHKSWDVYIIDYPTDSYIPPHIDPVQDGKKHYRLNIVLCGKDDFIGKSIFSFKNRVILFRPDIMEHSVSKVKYRRIVFSIGWLTTIK